MLGVVGEVVVSSTRKEYQIITIKTVPFFCRYVKPLIYDLVVIVKKRA